MTDVRLARSDDRAACVELLDAAMLEVESDRVRRRIEDGDVLVADANGRVVGVCVLVRRDDATAITQIAVHRSRRARGIGRRLVETAASRTDGPVTATFRRQVRPFYEALEFEITAIDEGTGDGENADGGRFRGVLR
ncbi:GNAT family N-acetyltransferase [Halogeometricum borinquense]|uniref:GNAT family N-acetyltransferase n=1 Tax=Halogeometricum borinquense TaxID=60847 RepID=UPI00019E6D68|nr:GNAT family N-acetyltransferase [Halogeometricum borinquense]